MPHWNLTVPAPFSCEDLSSPALRRNNISRLLGNIKRKSIGMLIIRAEALHQSLEPGTHIRDVGVVGESDVLSDNIFKFR